MNQVLYYQCQLKLCLNGFDDCVTEGIKAGFIKGLWDALLLFIKFFNMIT